MTHVLGGAVGTFLSVGQHKVGSIPVQGGGTFRILVRGSSCGMRVMMNGATPAADGTDMCLTSTPEIFSMPSGATSIAFWPYDSDSYISICPVSVAD